MITEKDYINLTELSHRKKFAQFFTPERIARFMSRWVLDGAKNRANVLEPAFGLGIFSREMLSIAPNIRVKGYDADSRIFTYASDSFAHAANIYLSNEDYITGSWSETYDAIICNPPYLKFHDYDNRHLIPHVNNQLRTHLTGFSNLYTLFLLKSIYQLRDGGRLAYIVPSEFLNADYGVEVKRYLIKSGMLRHVIVLDFSCSAFDDALTTACIILCENTDRSEEVRFSKIDSVTELSTALTLYKSVARSTIRPDVKWRQYYDGSASSEFQDLVPFATFAKVSRGIATGANAFFTLRPTQAQTLSLPQPSLRPCICHATDVKSLIFSTADFNELIDRDKQVYLFDGRADETNTYVKRYLNHGIGNGIHKKHLTSSRTPWYALENRRPSPIWVTVFNRCGLRFVRNRAGVYNLTTFHCVYNISDIDTDILFAYLITDMAKEIFRQNCREYGNGLIKFEPNDLNRGLVADLRLLSSDDRDYIHSLVARLSQPLSDSAQIIRRLDHFFRRRFAPPPGERGYSPRDMSVNHQIN